LKDNNALVIRTTEMLAFSEVEAGRLDHAEDLLQHVVYARRRVLGTNDPDTLEAIRGLEFVVGAKQDRAEKERPSGR
jgi:hypothetical protein